PPRANARERLRRKLGRGDYRKGSPVKTASVAHLRTPPALLPDRCGPAFAARVAGRCADDADVAVTTRANKGRGCKPETRPVPHGVPTSRHVTRNRRKV